MRHISTITVEEGKGLWDAVMPEIYKPFNGVAHKFDEDKETPERVVFSSGVERLGIYFDGHIWADSDLNILELDRRKVFKYLHSLSISTKGFRDCEHNYSQDITMGVDIIVCSKCGDVI